MNLRWRGRHSNARADPAGTAEELLDGYLGMALGTRMEKRNWKAPPEIEALFPKGEESEAEDGIAF